MLSLERNMSVHNELQCNADSNNSEHYPIIPPAFEIPKEWSYTMRRNMQEVVPRLYLGPYSSANRGNLQTLTENGITHIVCVRQDIEAHFIKPNFPEKFKYLVLNIADAATENIIQHFSRVKAFIDDGLREGGQVLVHGNAGISRSAALVLAYVMETYGLTYARAYSIVQQRRFCINPNDGFMAQLREYEPIYQAQKTLKNGQQSSMNQRNKRSFNQLDAECSQPMES